MTYSVEITHYRHEDGTKDYDVVCLRRRGEIEEIWIRFGPVDTAGRFQRFSGQNNSSGLQSIHRQRVGKGYDRTGADLSFESLEDLNRLTGFGSYLGGLGRNRNFKVHASRWLEKNGGGGSVSSTPAEIEVEAERAAQWEKTRPEGWGDWA